MARLSATFAPAIVLFVAGLCPGGPGSSRAVGDRITLADGTRLDVETVAGDLDTVWDMTWGPGGEIWFTERGGRVSTVDPESGVVTVVGEIDVRERGEGGLMGLALHPDFPQVPWVYAAHTYDTGGGAGNRLVRMRFQDGRLETPETLLDGLAGAGNHNGSRLAIGPDRMLYMTMGDAGRRSRAQDREDLNGSILRLTLEGAPAPGNPFGNEIWTWGHRNPQGLAFQPGTGRLYAAEHGPDTDDEVNLVEAGGNYGWPEVRGYCDTPEEREFCRSAEVVEPVEAWTPTVGIAGADFYRGDAIPGWDGSLLVTSLRGASLFRLTLGGDGRRAVSTERLLQGELGRLRAVLVGPDGAVYLATSNRDGRGRPGAGDDRIVRLTAAPG